jgi:fumarate reductase iron-sulfur subunit
MGRQLEISVFRYNPNDPESKPRTQVYKIDEIQGMTFYQALTQIRKTLDPSLMFDFVCRAAICGSCAMLINGKPKLACKTQTADYPTKVNLLPLPVFKLVGDLAVDTGSWFRTMSGKIEGWVKTKKKFDPNSLEEKMSNKEAQDIYELDRCIECGCCISGCATMNVKPEFLGAAGILRVGRFFIDPRDQRDAKEFFDVIGTDDGMFGCMSLMACQDYCPKEIPLMNQLANIRRNMAMAAFK